MAPDWRVLACGNTKRATLSRLHGPTVSMYLYRTYKENTMKTTFALIFALACIAYTALAVSNSICTRIKLQSKFKVYYNGVYRYICHHCTLHILTISSITASINIVCQPRFYNNYDAITEDDSRECFLSHSGLHSDRIKRKIDVG